MKENSVLPDEALLDVTDLEEVRHAVIMSEILTRKY